MSERHLSAIEPGEQSIEEVITWGISPMRSLVHIMDDTLGPHATDDPDEKTLLFVANELSSKLETIEEVLEKFVKWEMEVKRKLNGDTPGIDGVDPAGD